MGRRFYGLEAEEFGHTSYIATPSPASTGGWPGPVTPGRYGRRVGSLRHPHFVPAPAYAQPVPEDQPAKVTLGHLTRAERICGRRLKLEHRNARSNFGSNGRWRVSNRVTEEIRLAHTELSAPRLDRFDAAAGDLTPEQRRVYELATRWYVTLFTRPVRVVDEDQWGTDIPGDLRLVGPAGLGFTDEESQPEIRLLRFDARPAPPAALIDTPAVRFALLRRVAWLQGRTVHVAVADLVRGTYEEGDIETEQAMPEITTWLAERIEAIRQRIATPTPQVGLECGWCPFIAGCEPHR
jgi:hypothetical protein